MTVELRKQEPSPASNDTVADLPEQPSRIQALKALGKKVAKAAGKAATMYKEVVEAALSARAECTTDEEIRALFEEAREAGIIKRIPQQIDSALITPLVIDAVLSEVKNQAGDSTRSRLNRIVDYTIERGCTLDELIREHKGLWNIYGAWRKDKVGKQVTTASTTITIQLVIPRELGESIQAGQEGPRLVWMSAKKVFALEPLPARIAEEARADASMKSVSANENFTAADDTLAIDEAAGTPQATASNKERCDLSDELADEEESAPEKVELRAATATYLGRHITLGALGGGLAWKQFKEHVTSGKAKISGTVQPVYRVERVTPELLALLRKGNAVLVDVDLDEEQLKTLRTE